MDDIRYELVEIATRSPALFTDIGKAPPMTMKGELYRPAAADGAPFPAVVVSDARGGIKQARERPYACHLARNGYAVLVLDSYAGRGLGGVARAVRLYRVTEAMMLADAFAGLTFLAARPDIAADRIHHLGFAHGGMIALLSAFDQLRETCLDGDAAFASHSAFYGLYAFRLVDYRTRGRPVAIFYGGQDDTHNHARLDLLAGDLRNSGADVRIIGHDIAYHEWDREDPRPGSERLNLSDLAGRIDPANVLCDDRSGRPIATLRARGRWLARNASLFAVEKKRNEEVTERTRADLLAHLAAAGAQEDERPERPALRVVGGDSHG